MSTNPELVSGKVALSVSRRMYTNGQGVRVSRHPVKPTPEERMDIAEALMATTGNVAMAGKRLNQSRGWLDARIMADPLLTELVEEIKDSIVDNMLSAMQIKGMAGDYACMNRIINMWGRDRGLHEKQEITIEHVDESPQTLELRLTEKLGALTPDQIRMLAGLD